LAGFALVSPSPWSAQDYPKPKMEPMTVNLWYKYFIIFEPFGKRIKLKRTLAEPHG
jgi:hypothetical protein